MIFIILLSSDSISLTKWTALRDVLKYIRAINKVIFIPYTISPVGFVTEILKRLMINMEVNFQVYPLVYCNPCFNHFKCAQIILVCYEHHINIDIIHETSTCLYVVI